MRSKLGTDRNRHVSARLLRVIAEENQTRNRDADRIGLVHRRSDLDVSVEENLRVGELGGGGVVGLGVRADEGVAGRDVQVAVVAAGRRREATDLGGSGGRCDDDAVEVGGLAARLGDDEELGRIHRGRVRRDGAAERGVAVGDAGGFLVAVVAVELEKDLDGFGGGPGFAVDVDPLAGLGDGGGGGDLGGLELDGNGGG